MHKVCSFRFLCLYQSKSRNKIQKKFKKLLTNGTDSYKILLVLATEDVERQMHEWLSGGVSPCQGEGRGFESRLVLLLVKALITYSSSF